jgi:hypothetical protein
MRYLSEWCRSDNAAATKRVPLSALMQVDAKDAFDSVLPSDGVSELVVVDDEGEPVLEAMFMPADCEWPTFATGKQDDATGRSVVFRRISRADRARTTHTVQRLLDGLKTGWIGTAGIGKSTGINDVLVQLLRHLGDEGWPSQVGVRMPPFAHVFTRVDGSILVTKQECHSMLQVERLSLELKSNNGVLLLELEDSDVDPKVRCPVVVSVSTRKADEMLKTLRKAHLKWLIVSPPTLPEIRAMALLLFASGDLTLGKMPGEVLATIEKRYAVVGPILRFIFCTEIAFLERVFEQNGIDGQTLISDLKDASLTDIPRKASLFMGVFLHDTVDVPHADPSSYEWRFLSYARAEAAARLACKTPAIVESLQRFGIMWQVLEAVVQCAVRGDKDLEPEYALDKWECYNNPYRINGSVSQMLASVPWSLPGAAPHPLVLFPGGVLHDVRKLRAGVVYRSLSYQAKLADLYIFDHEQRKAFLIQTSDRLPNKHPFPIEHIIKVHKALKLGIEYTLVIVFVCPQDERSREKLKGIVVVDDKKHISLAQARKKLPGIKVEAFVVRAPIIPGTAPVIYNEKNAAEANVAEEKNAAEEENAVLEEKAAEEEKAATKDGGM